MTCPVVPDCPRLEKAAYRHNKPKRPQNRLQLLAVGGSFIFDNGRGEPISLTNVGRICKEAGRQVNVSRFHTHAARHYRTVELDEEEVGIETIRRFLGHSKLSTTQIYLRGRRNKTRDEIIKKDKHFSGLRKTMNPHYERNDHAGMYGTKRTGDIDKWAYPDSNRRPPPCEGDVITN